MSLSSFLTGIADAIRAKDGSTETIPASDFAERIAALSGGGDVVTDATAGIVITTTATTYNSSSDYTLVTILLPMVTDHTKLISFMCNSYNFHDSNSDGTADSYTYFNGTPDTVWASLGSGMIKGAELSISSGASGTTISFIVQTTIPTHGNFLHTTQTLSQWSSGFVCHTE